VDWFCAGAADPSEHLWPRKPDPKDHGTCDDCPDRHRNRRAESGGQGARLDGAERSHSDQRLRVKRHHATSQMVRRDRLDAAVGDRDK
jgi:hypothetical protein